MKCLFCGKNRVKIISERVRDSKKHKIVKCKDCGLLQIWPVPPSSKEKIFYAQNRQAKNIKDPDDIKTIKEKLFLDNQRRSEMISKIISKDSAILDVGSGYGFFLQAMIDKGYKNIVGTEISEEKINVSKKITRAEVLNINLLEEDSLLKKFDCITLFHVLEHIREPVNFLKNIRKKLKDKGILVIEVPNCEDMLLSVSQEYMNFYWQLAHLSYFNRKVLGEIINKSEFVTDNVIYIQRYGIENLINWISAGTPQIEKSAFEIEGAYAWLEKYYKNYLCSIGKSDTMIFIAKNREKQA